MINFTGYYNNRNSFNLRLYTFNNRLSSLENREFKQLSFQANKSINEPSQEDFVSKIFKTVFENIKEDNLIGEGLTSKVYKFDEEDFSKYVIKVIKKGFDTHNIKVNEFEGMNLGQPVFKIADNILILKRKEGLPHSVLNWNEIKDGVAQITEKQAEKFCSDIEKLANMPDETYLNFASQVKYLSDKGYKIDSINPNNLLIDYDNQRINVIDFYKMDRPYQKNSYLDMAAPLLDFILFEQYEQKMDKVQRYWFEMSADMIVQKCYHAARKVGLPTDKSLFEKYIEKVGFYFTYPCTEYYRNMCDKVYVI